jgi:hypothetical protein
MLRIVELINGARAVGIQRDRHSNSVVWAGRRRLRDDQQADRSREILKVSWATLFEMRSSNEQKRAAKRAINFY